MIVKNDIKTIPFDKFYEDYTSFVDSEKEIRLEEAQDYVERKNAQLIKAQTNKLKERFARDYESLESNEAAELGEDQFEADARESLPGLPDPKKVTLSYSEVAEVHEEAVQEIVLPFIEKYKLDLKFSWVLQQIMARIGTWKPVKSDTSGLYNGKLLKESLQENYDKGILLYTLQKRSSLIKGPDVRLYKESMFNPLVPLVLASFKIYQDVPYSKWERSVESLQPVVDKDLGPAMLAQVPNLTTEQRLHIQRIGLAIAKGTRAGKQNDPVSFYTLYHLSEDDFCIENGIDKLPRLAQIMLAQTWCAHPVNRNKYQILNPNNWDEMPEPILAAKVILEEETTKRKKRFSSVEVPVWGSW